MVVPQRETGDIEGPGSHLQPSVAKGLLAEKKRWQDTDRQHEPEPLREFLVVMVATGSTVSSGCMALLLSMLAHA